MKPQLLALIENRTSALSFRPAPLPQADVELLFEAARWSPSSYNEQPWVFHYASRANSKAFGKLLATLVPANQEWAANASLLIISTAQITSHVSGGDNYYSLHDTGLATASLVLQAQSMGLASHIMGGFDHGLASQAIALPNGYRPVAAIAVGYPDSIDTLSEPLKTRALSPRSRKPLGSVALEVQG